jgi:biopolymer transport protein TolR
MVTAPLINPGQVELPQIGKTSDPPVQPLEVSVRSDQSLWVRDRATAGDERKVNRDELVALIKQKQAKNPNQAVVIAADKDVRYAAVLEVMDMLQSHQVQKVGLLAKPRQP